MRAIRVAESAVRLGGVDAYLDACVAALRSNNPVAWPAYQEDGERVWKYIARSIGAGLDVFEPREVAQAIKSLYGRLVVACTFGTRGGVPVDAVTFLGWMREGEQEARIG